MDFTAGQVFMSYSTNGGASWTVPLSIYTPASFNPGSVSFAGSCQTNAATPQFFFEWINNAAGANKYRINYTTCTLISTGTSPCATATVPVNKNGFPININSANTVGVGCANWPGFECALDNHNSLLFVYQGANNVLNITGVGASNGEISFNGNFYVLVLTQSTGTSGTYYTSTSGALNTWSTAKSWSSANAGNMQVGTQVASGQGWGSWLISSPSTLQVIVAYTEKTMGGNCAVGLTYCIETVSIGGGGAATTTIQSTNNQCQPSMISDNVNWAITCVAGTGASSAYEITTNNGLTYTSYTFASGGFSSPNAGNFVATGTYTSIAFAMGAYPVVEVSQAANYNVYVQMFGTFTGSSGGGTTSVTLGSCPTKNTATTALTNNTEFFWTATALGGTIISQVTAEVASVNSGHAASETLYFMLYTTAVPGAVSAGNPIVLINVKQWTLSATASPQLLSWLATSGPNIQAGDTYGIAIMGNTKILVNQSSLSGMLQGSSATGTPVATFTALSTSTAQLFFCGNANYQNVVTTTITSTSTQTSISTTSVGGLVCTSTSTSVVSSLDQNAALGNSVNYVLVIFMVLGPAVVLAVVGALLRSAVLTGVFFIAGMTIGAGAGNLSGIVPFNIMAMVVILIVFMILGLLMIIRSGGGSSGG